MAVSLLSRDLSDLCLGKPALRSLPISATVGDALSALKRYEESYLSVWSCDHNQKSIDGCRCVGKLCMVDIVCYICREENLSDPVSALGSPVSVLLHEASASVVRHVQLNTSLLEALDLILDGVQNLVVPIQTHSSSNSSRKKHARGIYIGNTSHANGLEFCWLTQEDVLRFLFSSIGLFSPLTALSVNALDLIRTDVLTVGYHEPASSAVDRIALALSQQTSIAVVSPDGKLIGEISPSTLAACSETVAPAIATLSAGDLMAYVACGGLSSNLLGAVKAMLRKRGMKGMLELLEDGEFSASSSDDESGLALSSLDGSLRQPSVKYSRSSSYSSRMVRRAEAIVCHPESSLVAVMVQALVHRVNYVWVIENDYSLAGIVTFSDVLQVFCEHLQAIE